MNIFGEEGILFLVGGNRSRKLVPVWSERSWWWYCSDCRLCRAQEGLSPRPDRYGESRPFRVFLLKLSALTFGRGAKGQWHPNFKAFITLQMIYGKS